jgi:homopolymeric O-antigen transport system ATP-binding protein
VNDIVIKVENLSKQYRIGSREGYRTFRETLVDAAKAPFQRLGAAWSRVHRARGKGKDSPLFAPSPVQSSQRDDLIWALKEVSFEVKQGDVVGIIGRNGAGKSTLLKILSQITEPTEGRVELRGRVGSLLEVGTGFHPELTGHENIYLYGAILGMDRWEVTRKFDEIVAFAEIEKFVDTPVKRYSSGMYMRLAFAVAAHLETEVLLVDEVLAVGDIAFQKKCLGKMDDVSKSGKTILFVSHNMGAIRQLCKEAVLLDSGRIQGKGESSAIVAEYEKHETSDIMGIWINTDEEEKNQLAFVEKIEVQDDTLQNKDIFSSSQNVCIAFTVNIKEENPDLKLGFDLIRNAEVVFRSQHVDCTQQQGILPVGINTLVCKIPGNLLNCGSYYIYPLFSVHMIRDLYRRRGPAVKFDVELDTSRSPFHMVLNEKNHPGPVFPLLNWKVN